MHFLKFTDKVRSAMKYTELIKIVKELPFDTYKIILNAEGIEVSILRPSKLPTGFVKYDPKKNFQIWFAEGDRKFKPNHLRVMIDLYLRSRSRQDLKKELLSAFDSVFYGEDPGRAIEKLKKEEFEHFLNPLIIIATFCQLFIAEQEYAYPTESKYEPRTLFFQGWIRQVIAENKEIDNLAMSIASGQPPAQKFTYKEDRKHKKFDANFKPLWYLEEKI